MPKGVARLHFLSEAIKATPALRAQIEEHATAAVEALYAPVESSPAPTAQASEQERVA
ncbi:MAG: hypothetical protein AB7N76_05160 [Planctomycetota bacterium]